MTSIGGCNNKVIYANEIMKKLLKLSLLELVSMIAMLLYGIGVVVLMQYNSLYLGFEEFDFLRLKPILVGLQFVIYMALPYVVFFLPFVIVSYMHMSWWRKVVYIVFMILCLMVVIGMMFHYFLPYTQIISDDSCIGETMCIVKNFWKLYFYWDVHLVPLIIFSFMVFLLLRLTRNKKANIFLLKRKITKGKVILVMILLMFGNLYFFNRDVYMNIRQSACGGAPVAGIITIRDPSEIMLCSNSWYAENKKELSKPCFLVSEDSNFLYIADMFEVADDIAFLKEKYLPRSMCRISKTNVLDFSPISYYQWWRNGKAWKIGDLLMSDIVQHIQFTVTCSAQKKDGASILDTALNAKHSKNNTPVLTVWADNDGSDSIKANCLSVIPKEGTNLVVRMIFSPIRCQRGQVVYNYMNSLTNTKQKIGFRVDDLPCLPDGFKWSNSLGMSVRCNLINSLDVTKSYVPLFKNNDRTLIMVKHCFIEGIEVKYD